jgi:hypothetical protein
MLYAPDTDIAPADHIGHGGGLAPVDRGHLARLEAVVAGDTVFDGAALGVALTVGCGVVEVRVSGPTAELSLPFDRAELDPAYVRRVVADAVTRYKFALRGRQSKWWKGVSLMQASQLFQRGRQQ